MSACAPLVSRQRWTAPAHPTAATAPFARLDLIGPDTWALVSTPQGGDRTTFANGGIIAGRAGVVAVEGFYRPAGATWLAERARELTGRWPTHVVLSHYHVDHASGVAGYRNTQGADPRVYTTAQTREAVLAGGPVAPPRDEELTRRLADVVLVGGPNIDRDLKIDLGNRTVRLRPLSGHSSSDLCIVDDDARMVWMGDLMWNGLLPNYVDAVPSSLARSVRTLSAVGATTYIPGHGAVAGRDDVARYIALLDEIEQVARRAFSTGTTPAAIAATYRIPPSLGEWTATTAYIERAMSAWHRELRGSATR